MLAAVQKVRMAHLTASDEWLESNYPCPVDLLALVGYLGFCRRFDLRFQKFLHLHGAPILFLPSRETWKCQNTRNNEESKFADLPRSPFCDFTSFRRRSLYSHANENAVAVARRKLLPPF